MIANFNKIPLIQNDKLIFFGRIDLQCSVLFHQLQHVAARISRSAVVLGVMACTG